MRLTKRGESVVLFSLMLFVAAVVVGTIGIYIAVLVLVAIL